MTDTTLADKIEALADTLNRERMMLADIGWYWDEGMPATAAYLETVFEVHDHLPTILRALRERDQAVEALRGLVDDEPCRHDHHGYCQTHYVTEPCEMHVARTTLASIEGTGHE